MTIKQPLLEVQQLQISFGDKTVLHNIHFDVKAGECLAIVGESGSGKSLTSLAIMRLLPEKNIQISGNICLHTQGESIDLLSLSQKDFANIRGQRIAMIFQEPMTSLNPVLTCGQQVAEAIILHEKISEKEAKKAVIQLFNQVELPEPEVLYHKYPHQISGGQKQRVMIAMAISCRPNLLICDEPTTALDVTVQKSVIELLQKIQKESNISLIFISHDLNVVSEIADKILVLYKGNIEEYGSKSQILTAPQNNYTKALLACRPALYDKGERLPIVRDFLEGKNLEKATTKSEYTPPKSQEKIVEIKNLDVWYPTKKNILGKAFEYYKAITDLSLDIFKGETIGLVGGSGCGKSTLGRSILKLTPNTSGQIIFQNQRIDNLSEKEFFPLRPKIQLIFQDPYSALNPKIRIGEAIASPLLKHDLISKKEIKDYVMYWLQKVDLTTDSYDKLPHQFSGGQRQRIVIARALALKPAFVVCDESVSALDVSVQSQVLNLLNDLKKELNFSAIFISHDLSVVKYICDRIMVMHQGQIIETGAAEEVYYHPKQAYTKTLLDAIPQLKTN